MNALLSVMLFLAILIAAAELLKIIFAALLLITGIIGLCVLLSLVAK